MCGKVGAGVQYPAPLMLNEHALPWFVKGFHLGHELHKNFSIDYDAKFKRGAFIARSTDIREMFSFANPGQVLDAVSVYASHFYGSMLWDLYSEGAGQVYRSWNTCVKLAWDTPRMTHNLFVEMLSGDLPSVRKQILCQYMSFFRKLRQSPLREVRILANLVGRDTNSVTGRNLSNLMEEFPTLDPWTHGAAHFKTQYRGYLVPDEDQWRLPLLKKLLYQRREMDTCGEDVTTITELIDSLCTS